MVAAVVRELFEPLPPDFWFPATWLGDSFANAWGKVAADVLASGDVEPLHATRDRYHAQLMAAFVTLTGHLALAEGSEDRAAVARIGRSREVLQKHHDSLFPRWQTLDDLEGILLERITPSNAELIHLAEVHSPLQSWYEETGEPF